jgi:hypothetical protein
MRCGTLTLYQSATEDSKKSVSFFSCVPMNPWAMTHLSARAGLPLRIHSSILLIIPFIFPSCLQRYSTRQLQIFQLIQARCSAHLKPGVDQLRTPRLTHGTPSARSPSVLAHYCTLTWTAFVFAVVVVGRCTFSTPSRNSAVTFVLSVSSGSVKLRRKLPKERSMRWNFVF